MKLRIYPIPIRYWDTREHVSLPGNRQRCRHRMIGPAVPTRRQPQSRYSIRVDDVVQVRSHEETDTDRERELYMGLACPLLLCRNLF